MNLAMIVENTSQQKQKKKAKSITILINKLVKRLKEDTEIRVIVKEEKPLMMSKPSVIIV